MCAVFKNATLQHPGASLKTRTRHMLNMTHRCKYPSNTIKRLGRDGSKSGASSWCSCHNWLNGFWDCGLPNNAPGILVILKKKRQLQASV
jgi:hypothetical protein